MSTAVVIGSDAGTPARVGDGSPLLVIAGPCVIESASETLRTAAALADICRELELGFVFKSSYLKDNRTAIDSFVGPGIDDGLRVLQRVREEIGVPVLSDVHERDEIPAAAQVLDVLQIPAFLCRQTRLLTDAARTGRCVNVKKGQFLSPDEVEHLVRKYESCGSGGLLVTERGTSFGYGNLVVDMRSLAILRRYGHPVVFDVTHSLQRPGGAGRETGGEREFAPLMARAACAAGVEALFLEAHPEPARALSDKHTQIPLEAVRDLLLSARAFHALRQRVAPS
jgi:2-dehydro-3-deoxyphosphooctonate aldolase (KDO 8-P synthase)